MKNQTFHFPIFLFGVLTVLFSCQEKKAVPPQDNFSVFIQKAEKFEQEYQFDSAYFNYNQAKLNVPLDSEQAAYGALNSAALQHYIGDFFGCEETITEALNHYKGTFYLPYFYNLLAICYHKQNNLEESLSYYEKALEQSVDSLDRIIYKNNIGLIYQEKKAYATAAKYFTPLLSEALLKKNRLEYARVLDNLGYVCYLQDKESGLPFMTEALHIRDSLSDYIGLMASHMHLSEYYQNKDLVLAKAYAQKAQNAALKSQSPDDQLESLKWLTRFGTPEESKQYYQRYIALNDSITKVRSGAKNQFAKIKYDSKKAIQEVVKYKNQKSILLLLMGLLFVIAYLGYRLYQIKNKRKLQQATYLTETRISKKIHDELANDVFNTMTFAQTQNLELPEAKDRLLDSMEHIYRRTRNIAKENSEIRTDAHFESDFFQMIDSFSDAQLKVIRKITEELNWYKMSAIHKITLYRVIQELLVNTKKHSQATFVVVSFTDKKNSLEVQYSDNGIGLKTAQIHKSGLQNAETRILAIQGSLIFDTNNPNGFRVTVSIPK